MINKIQKMLKRRADKKKKNSLLAKFKVVGENIELSTDLIVAGAKNISFGSNVYVGPRCLFYAANAELNVGSHVMFGPEVMIITGDHRFDLKGIYMDEITAELKLPQNDQPVRICDDVWIGARALILKGITIGEGSIVAAGATVLKDVPPYSIYYSKDKIRPRFKN